MPKSKNTSPTDVNVVIKELLGKSHHNEMHIKSRTSEKDLAEEEKEWKKITERDYKNANDSFNLVSKTDATDKSYADIVKENIIKTKDAGQDWVELVQNTGTKAKQL